MINNFHVLYSIVSHGQLYLIKNLLSDLRLIIRDTDLIVVVINIPEDESILLEFQDLNLKIIRNLYVKGFGENHNTVFGLYKCNFFAVVNPDILLNDFSINKIINVFDDPKVGAVAPLVLSPDLNIEDSARKFPSFMKLVFRFLFNNKSPEYHVGNELFEVDWVAGMFVILRSSAFELVHGFDIKYFMYYEDADICLRLRKFGYRIFMEPTCSVIHIGQRKSRRNFRYFIWHLDSAVRILLRLHA